MKKTASFIIVLLLLCAGCTQATPVETAQPTVVIEGVAILPEIRTFVFSEEYELWKDDPGTRLTGFVNTTEQKITTAAEAVARASAECRLPYDTVSVYYDRESQMWMVLFYKEYTVGGGLSVYLDSNGITHMTVAGE